MLFTITKEDYLNSGKSFLDIYTCPFTTAAKRQLYISAETIVHTGVHSITINNGLLGSIKPDWSGVLFSQLKQAVEENLPFVFEAEYTPGPLQF